MLQMIYLRMQFLSPLISCPQKDKHGFGGKSVILGKRRDADMQNTVTHQSMFDKVVLVHSF